MVLAYAPGSRPGDAGRAMTWGFTPPYGVRMDASRAGERQEEPDRAWWFRQVVLAAAVAAFEVLITLVASHNQPERESLDVLAVTLLVAGAAALPFRRRHPVGVMLFAEATTITYWVLGYAGGPIFLAMIIAYFQVALSGRRAVAWVILVTGFAAFALLPWLVGDEQRPELGALLGATAWMLVIGTAAEIFRNRRERVAETARNRREEERRRMSEERLRIARELHDVLAHNISMINVQAGVALHLIDEQPDQARPALTAIKQASKEALTELRSVLGVLRRVDEEEDGSRDPAPTLGRLSDLVARTRATGLTVHLRIEGEVHPVPAPVDLAGFRIAQEGLTNVVRHARATAATVVVTYGEDSVTVEVEDDGRGAGAQPSSGSGSGLLGMRERAESVGGVLEAGPRPNGSGFRVRARLPIVEEAE